MLIGPWAGSRWANRSMTCARLGREALESGVPVPWSIERTQCSRQVYLFDRVPGSCAFVPIPSNGLPIIRAERAFCASEATGPSACQAAGHDGALREPMRYAANTITQIASITTATRS